MGAVVLQKEVAQYCTVERRLFVWLPEHPYDIIDGAAVIDISLHSREYAEDVGALFARFMKHL